MSCGNSFSCGIHRFDKYKFPQHDKPANKVLHDENEKRLRELMQLREQQDHGVFQRITVQPATIPPITSEKQDTTLLQNDSENVLYYSVSDTKLKKD
jgi:hypothetical protein